MARGPDDSSEPSKRARALAKYRRSELARLIMSRVHVRPKSKRCTRFGLEAVRAVLAAFGHRSVWSGGTDDLTVVRIDRAHPLDIDNAMVLQVREAGRSVPRAVILRAKSLGVGLRNPPAKKLRSPPKRRGTILASRPVMSTDMSEGGGVDIGTLTSTTRTGHV